MIDTMNIESASYCKDVEDNNVAIKAVIEGSLMAVPLDPANRHYAEILRQVEAGELTIAEASAE